MGWSLAKALGWNDNKYLKKEELFPGAPKPSHILVGMCIAKMKADLQHIRNRGSDWCWRKDDIEIIWYHYDGSMHSFCILLKGKSFPLQDSEIQTLKKECREAMAWKRKYDENKQEMDRQQQAVDLIEEFFKPKALPTPDVEEHTKCEFSCCNPEPETLLSVVK